VNGDATTPSWYYAKTGAVDGQQIGPVSWEQLYSLAQTGALTSADLVWNPQFPSWVTAAEVPGLVAPPLPPARPVAAQPTAARPGAIQPAAARPGAIQPTAARKAVGPPSSYDPFMDEDGMDEFGGQRSWLRWGMAIGAVVVIAVILAVYFLVIRGGSAEPATTLPPTTTSEATTTTEAVDVPMTDSVWAELSSTGEVPAARSEHAVAYDSATGDAIFFGGWDATGTTFNDTWAFSSTLDTWTKLSPSGTLPASRAQHQMVYDPVSGKVILFGGVVKELGTQLNDTWAYDPVAKTWKDLKPAGDKPSTRGSFGMVYDAANKMIILFGGWSNDTSAHLNDTWAYDPAKNTWAKLNPTGDVPTSRGNFGMAYDTDEQAVVLFGGTDSTAYFNDTYVFDYSANTWTAVVPTGDLPPLRAGHKMTYDPISGYIVLFGGWDGTATEYFNDTWGYSVANASWTDLNPAGDLPPGRDGHSLIYVAANTELILFGGFLGGSDVSQDTWSFGTGETTTTETSLPDEGTTTSVVTP
jgi:N-acetylneuraminic acid mutarotase